MLMKRLFERVSLKLIFPLAFLLFAGCTRIKSVNEFNKWLGEEKRGCTLNKRIGGVSITVQYKPPAYAVLKDIELMKRNAKGKLWDSLMTTQEKLVTFIMTIEPDKEVEKAKQASSIMYEGVTDRDQYADRVVTTNFFMDQHVKLYIGSKVYKPVMAVVENLYELSDVRNFNIVFAPDKFEKGNWNNDYLFVYEDPFFGIGNVQFNFLKANLRSAENVSIGQ
jgi:hypothetical protein